jgi:hypothetical protein
MDEDEFDAWPGLRPFDDQAAKNVERIMMVAAKLWGATPEFLEQQLRAPVPEIPSDFDLADFRTLERHAQTDLIIFKRKGPGYSWGPFRFLMDADIIVGSDHFTWLEARCEIVRRAIEFLENNRK